MNKGQFELIHGKRCTFIANNYTKSYQNSQICINLVTLGILVWIEWPIFFSQTVSLTIGKVIYVFNLAQKKKRKKIPRKETDHSIDADKSIHIVTENRDNVRCLLLLFMTT